MTSLSRVNISVRLRPNKVEKLNKLASALKCRRSELIRDFINQGLEAHEGHFLFTCNDSQKKQKIVNVKAF